MPAKLLINFNMQQNSRVEECQKTQEIDINLIPETPEQIKDLAAHACDNMCPVTPEYQRVVYILNIASKRLEKIGL